MDIRDKIAIVTGGLGGIGFCAVQHLLMNGAKHVAIFDLPQSDSPSVVDSLKKLEKEFEKNESSYHRVDVADAESFAAAYKQVAERKGYVDILVNNAGVANDREVDMTIDTNLRAMIKGTLHAVENMGIHIKHGDHKGGVVVNVASFLGLINRPLAPVYNATKHGVVSFVQSMKEHNKTVGVRILCICPGFTQTNMISHDKLRKVWFDFVSSDIFEEELDHYYQNPNNVASAIVEIIKKGEDGAVWIVQDDELPLAVDNVDELEKLRILL